jgi:phospholipid-binding lipoprotein MlaA
LNRSAGKVGALVLCLTLAACAGTQNRHTDPVNDPWEGFNRKVYAFNDHLDKIVLRPAAKVYDKVMPDPVQRGVGNFFKNLDAPVTVVNEILQGKLKEGGVSIGRFLINSTIGLLGFFDVATKMGIPFYEEDLGQTLAKWGYEKSRYLVLPIFGPSTVRDGVTRYADTYYHPLYIYVRKENEYWPLIVRGVDQRAQLLSKDEELEQAYDPYVLLRDAWLQNRRYRIYDGNPPVTDYDSYLDEEPTQPQGNSPQ